MENMVSVGGLCYAQCFFLLGGGGLIWSGFFFGGVLVDEMHMNMDKLITCI